MTLAGLIFMFIGWTSVFVFTGMCYYTSFFAQPEDKNERRKQRVEDNVQSRPRTPQQ